MSKEHLFLNDYSDGGHPRVLEALMQSADTQEMGYGEDTHSQEAASLIQERINNPDAAVHFVSGGTQANLIVIASMLKPYESIIAPQTAHINIHEAGAIELTGHKINAVPSTDGKLQPKQIEQVVAAHTDEHMVKPRAVFISNATELGTIYTKDEISRLREVTKKKDLHLYMDGARLGTALTAEGSNLDLAEVSKMVDVFYIGGTKNGALFGEAVVINNPNLQENFRFYLKQHGALLAKGRALGVQFKELFKDDLYFDLAKHANLVAEQLAEGIKKEGYEFLADSPTNQIFPILPKELITKLEEKYGFYVWTEVDAEKSGIRLVTSWATPKEKAEGFLTDLKNLK